MRVCHSRYGRSKSESYNVRLDLVSVSLFHGSYIVHIQTGVTYSVHAPFSADAVAKLCVQEDPAHTVLVLWAPP